MNKNVIQDNILYIKEWMNINPALKEGLSIDGDNLIYQKENQTEIQKISKFYLPEMLYNESFRNKLVKDFTSEDLFQIIKVYCQAKEVIEANELEDQNSPKILNLQIKTEDDQKEFLVITTSDDKKYRFDTTEPEKMINIFLEEKNKKGYVTLNEFGRLIKND